MTKNSLFEGKKDYGFCIEDWRKKVWAIELRLSAFLDDLCKKHNLSYFLIGGGAIGAIRHQGFIPWDDDLDFGMKREDFQKLLLLLNDNRNDNVSFQYGTAGNFCSFLLRIRDNNSTGLVIDEKDYVELPHGVFIEVYPFDKAPNNYFLRKKQMLFATLYTKILSSKMHLERKNISSRILRFLFRHSSSLKIWNKLQKNSQKYNSKSTDWYDTTSLAHYYRQGIHHFKADWISSVAYFPFENINLPLCKGNDSCLRIQYGDYMKLPPISKRGLIHETSILYLPDTPYSPGIINDCLKERKKETL